MRAVGDFTARLFNLAAPYEMWPIRRGAPSAGSPGLLFRTSLIFTTAHEG